MSVEVFEDHSPDVDITFTKGDLRDAVPHDNRDLACYGGKDCPSGAGRSRKFGGCDVLVDF